MCEFLFNFLLGIKPRTSSVLGKHSTPKVNCVVVVVWGFVPFLRQSLIVEAGLLLIAEDGLELLIPLPPCLLVGITGVHHNAMLETEPMAMYILGKHSTEL